MVNHHRACGACGACARDGYFISPPRAGTLTTQSAGRRSLPSPLLVTSRRVDMQRVLFQ
jgi:hypothetical protein